jgi:hypothetical protein
MSNLKAPGITIAAAAGSIYDPIVPSFGDAMAADGNITHWHTPILTAGTTRITTVIDDQVASIANRAGGTALTQDTVNRRPAYLAQDVSTAPFGQPATQHGSANEDHFLVEGLSASDFWGLMVLNVDEDNPGLRNVAGGQVSAGDPIGGTHLLQASDGGVWRFTVGGGLVAPAGAAIPEAVVETDLVIGEWGLVYFSWDASAATAAISTDGIVWSTDTEAGAANAQTTRRINGAINAAGTGGTIHTNFDLADMVFGTGHLLDGGMADTLELLRAYVASRYGL